MEPKVHKIHTTYDGATSTYNVYLNDKIVHAASTAFDRDMFVAVLQAHLDRGLVTDSPG